MSVAGLSISLEMGMLSRIDRNCILRLIQEASLKSAEWSVTAVVLTAVNREN